MNTCYWLIDGKRCSNPVQNTLICDVCMPYKRVLYKRYKTSERKVINAISNPSVRGNIEEIRKVIARLEKVITLRKEFTSHLDPSVRDIGHDLRIRNLYDKVKEYRTELQSMFDMATSNLTIQEEEDQEIETLINDHQSLIDCTTKVNTIVKEIESDPFEDFSEDIRLYQQAMDLLREFWNKLKAELGFDDVGMTKSFHYMDRILNMSEYADRINRIFDRGTRSTLVSYGKLLLPIPDGYEWKAKMTRIFCFVSECINANHLIAYLKRIIPKMDNKFALLVRRRVFGGENYINIKNTVERGFRTDIIFRYTSHKLIFAISVKFPKSITTEEIPKCLSLMESIFGPGNKQ